MSLHDEVKFLITACLAAGILPKDIFSGAVSVVLVEGVPDCRDKSRLVETLRNISLGDQTAAIAGRFKACLGEDDYAKVLTGKFRIQKFVPASEELPPPPPVIELKFKVERPKRKRPSRARKTATVTSLPTTRDNPFEASPALVL